MNTLHTIQGMVPGSSPSVTPHSADEAASLHSIAQETVQNTVPISRAAHGAPVPLPPVPEHLSPEELNASNVESQKLEGMVRAQVNVPADGAPLTAEVKAEGTVDSAKMEDMRPAQSTVTLMGERVSKLYEDFTALQVAHLPPGGRSSAQWQDLQQQVRALLDRLPQNMDGLLQEEGADVLRVLLADSYEKLERYADSARVRESLLGSLQEGLVALEEEKPEVRLDYLDTEWAVILDSLRPDVDASRKMSQALHSLALGQPLDENYVQDLNAFRDHIVLFEEDYHALEADLDTHIGTVLREKMLIDALPDGPLADAVGANNVFSLCSLAQDIDLDVEDVTHMMQMARSAMTAAMPEAAPELFPAMLTALLQVAAEVKAEAANAAQRPSGNVAGKFAELLQHVDALFQQGYPESGGLALEFKRALVSLLALDIASGMEAGVEAQHHLTLSLGVLLDKAVNDKGTQGTAHGVKLVGASAVKDTLRHGMGSMGVSRSGGQSLLLTPATVRALTGGASEKGGHTGGVNYHLAHLVLLQATAADYGCINMYASAEKTDVPLSKDVDAQMPNGTKLTEADMVRNTLGTSIQQWCHTLGLDKATTAYAADVAQDLAHPDRADAALHHLQEACARYTKGLSGSDDVQRATKSLRTVGGMNALLHSIRHEIGFYSTDPHVQQRRALDMYLMGFSGNLKAEDRLENAQGLTLKAGALEAAIGTRVKEVFKDQEAKLQIIQGKLSSEEKTQMANRHSALLEGVHHRRTLMKHWKEMQKVAAPDKELLQVRGRYADSNAELANHKAERREMGIRWPHQHKERREFRNKVLSIGRFIEGKGNDRKALTPEDLAELKPQLEALAACDPFRLVRSRSKTPPPVTLDTVLDIMLPKAKALDYFADCGKMFNFGDRVIGRLSMGTGHLQELTQRRHAHRALGKEGIRTLRAAAEAAAIMALQASGQPRAAFNLRATEHRKAVMQQLSQWKLESSRSTNTLTSIVNVALRKVTFKDGTLNLDKLGKHAESWARHRIFADSKAPGQLSVYMKTRKEVQRSAMDATRSEGLSSLIDGLAMPGEGFVYDKGRGVVVDSGARFTPLGVPITRRGTRCPLSLEIQAMRNRSVAVVKTPTGYQVLLKDKDFLSTTLSGRMGLDHGAALSGSIGGSGDKTEGLALDFSDSAKCQRFLRDFMDHDSPLHPKDDANGARPSWLDAEQIRFLDGKGGSVNASLGLNLTLLTHFLDEEKQHALSGAASANASVKGNFSSEVERSSQGETVTVTSTFMASLVLGLSGSLINTGVGDSSMGTLTTDKTLNAMNMHTYDITKRVKISTDGTGLSAKTCHEYEHGGAGLRHKVFLDYLPPDMQKRLENNPQIMDKFREAGTRATPFTKVVVHCDITPEALDKARTLMMQARHSPQKQSEALLREAHALLAARSSYAPTRITIQDTQRQQVGHNYSPGLGFIKLARTNSVLRLQSEVISLKDLPEVLSEPQVAV